MTVFKPKFAQRLYNSTHDHRVLSRLLTDGASVGTAHWLITLTCTNLYTWVERSNVELIVCSEKIPMDSKPGPTIPRSCVLPSDSRLHIGTKVCANEIMSSKVTAFRVVMFRVVMLNENNVCHPGQVLQGQVLVHVLSDIHIRGIRVTCRGYGRTAWNSGKINHAQEEEYINQEITVYGQGGRSDVVLPAGQHALPFEIQLPPDIPASFEQDDPLRGCTRYLLYAVIDRQWKSNIKCKTYFTVLSVLDLDTQPNCAAPVTKFESKTNVCNGCLENDVIMRRWCCCCCPSEPLTASFTLNKTGFVPGESILVDSEICNYSDNVVRSSCLRLVMVITLKRMYRRGTYTSSVSIDSRKVLGRVQHGRVNQGEKVQYTRDMITVPPVPPTGLPGCNIIDIKYFMRFTVETTLKIMVIEIDADVIIGTVPLHSDVENVRQQNLAISPILDQPRGGIATVNSDLHPPTYPEIVFGTREIPDDDAADGTDQGSSSFAPSYTYYGWMSQNQTDELPTYESLFKDL